MAKTILITGGARSGKSSFALSLASAYPEKRVFLATAVAFDTEMEERIGKHRFERGDLFTTIEEPYCIDKTLSGIDQDVSVVLIDCLTVWAGNLFYRYENDPVKVQNHIDDFATSVTTYHYDLIMVTNEVGCGIIPDNALARMFRDTAGKMNQDIARVVDTVYLCSCGLPLTLKENSKKECV